MISLCGPSWLAIQASYRRVGSSHPWDLRAYFIVMPLAEPLSLGHIGSSTIVTLFHFVI